MVINTNFKKYVQKKAPAFTNDVLIEVYFRYNTAEDLKHIVFDEISEKYTGKDYHYVVGKLNLEQLIANRDYILKHKLFISLVDEKVSPVKVSVKENDIAKELVNH